MECRVHKEKIENTEKCCKCTHLSSNMVIKAYLLVWHNCREKMGLFLSLFIIIVRFRPTDAGLFDSYHSQKTVIGRLVKQPHTLSHWIFSIYKTLMLLCAGTYPGVDFQHPPPHQNT
jgi:hypothetical protein